MQNKKLTVLTMLCVWLIKLAPNQIEEAVFSVVGHSFMPPDRVFGWIEKVIKNTTCTCICEVYFEIIHFKINNIKQVGNWHFQL